MHPAASAQRKIAIVYQKILVSCTPRVVRICVITLMFQLQSMWALFSYLSSVSYVHRGFCVADGACGHRRYLNVYIFAHCEVFLDGEIYGSCVCQASVRLSATKHQRKHLTLDTVKC